MNWTDPILGYCERLATGTGPELFNLATGLVFAFVGWRAFRAAPRAEDQQAALALVLLGIASALHHGLAIQLTLLGDMLANQLYLVLLGRLMLCRLAGAGHAAALLGGAVAVALVVALLTGPAQLLVPGYLADAFVVKLLLLVGLALGLRRRHAATARAIALAATMLALGLPFRFLDAALCPVWPIGTHGLWHLANAGATALLLAALARHPVRPQGLSCEGGDAGLNGAKREEGPHGH